MRFKERKVKRDTKEEIFKTKSVETGFVHFKFFPFQSVWQIFFAYYCKQQPSLNEKHEKCSVSFKIFSNV